MRQAVESLMCIIGCSAFVSKRNLFLDLAGYQTTYLSLTAPKAKCSIIELRETLVVTW